jgi:hypothetical protein
MKVMKNMISYTAFLITRKLTSTEKSWITWLAEA